MTSSIDQEILQDFLGEAGELLETLNEELVELENRPDDMELLHKAFRAFHTIKGGGGFVGLDPLVEVCHRAEEVFSELRDGKLQVSAELMDPLLQTLDVVNDQFAACRDGQTPERAPPELLARLDQVLTTADAEADEPAASTQESTATASSASTETSQDPADAEFESLLSAAGEPAATPSGTEASTDTIEEDEFEALLDELHGSGAPPGQTDPQAVAQADESQEPPAAEESPPAADRHDSPPEQEEPSGDNRRGGDNNKPAETVRVDVSRLDAIMNLVGELVLVRNRLNTYSEKHHDTSLTSIADTLDRVTADVQTAVMDSRLQPVRKVFSRFPRLVRDLARDLDKPIELNMNGEDTELDKQVLDALSEPLVHLVRNAVDHGIEPPDEREQAGKPRSGHVQLTAAYVGDRVEITVAEDGRGLDAAKLTQRAVDKGLITTDGAAAMSEREAFELIFWPGFSTTEAISNISGRGVGMDAVKTKVNDLNGRVDINSTPGAGSSFTISVPLTLAILPTLMVTVSGQRFALPLSTVSEVCELDTRGIHYINEQPVLIIREHPLSVFRASEYLGLPTTPATGAHPGVVVVIELENRRVGLIVDEILGQEEAVMKPLGVFVRKLPGMAGGTVTGDGRIALILDVLDLLQRARPVRYQQEQVIAEAAEA